MKISSSVHHVSLLPSENPVWFDNRRLSLNIHLLLLLINAADDPSSGGSTSSGKKRARPPSSEGSSKRAKLSVSSSNNISHLHNEDTPDTNQPIPVLRHVTEIHYTIPIPNEGKRVRDYPPPQMLNNLTSLLSDTEPRTVDLGLVHFSEDAGRYLTVFPEHLPSHFLSPLQFLVLPVPLSIDLDPPNIAQNVDNILMVAHILASANRATIEGYLDFVVPPGAYDEANHEISFHIRLSTLVSLILPNLAKPITDVTHRRFTQIKDVQRYCFEYIFPSTLSFPLSFQGETDIPFLYSVLGHAPKLPSDVSENSMQPDSLVPKLLPFQRRSVGWLLSCEGKTVTPSGQIVAAPNAPSDKTLAPFWERIDIGNSSLYVNRLDGTVSVDPAPDYCPMGGILAEEPGLGKTLMCISLILLNPAPNRNPTNMCWDPTAKLDVKEIKTTLIVTPHSLASQWADECALHAPMLRVLIYDGWSKVQVPITEDEAEAERQRRLKITSKGSTAPVSSKSKRSIKNKRKRKRRNYESDESTDDEDAKGPTYPGLREEVLDWCSYINTFDVCITTYNVLRQDLCVARPAPTRPRREDVVYSNIRRRSPLVMCEWYRVIMDEVQMAGGGKVEDMVSLLPRLSSFAVSGTPARSQVSDLWHILKFLRVEGVIGSQTLWKRLLTPAYAGRFRSFFQKHAIRTMKSSVKNELTIPQQTRFLVSIELGPVEKHVYDQTLEQALLELGLDARGVAAYEGWRIDDSLLRSILRRLRGICTHPQVGQLQKLGENLHKQGALKSMNDVLETMKDQNWRNFVDDRKARILSLVRYAQLQQLDEGDHARYKHASETLVLAEKETNQLIDDFNASIAAHNEKGDVLKMEAAAALQESRQRSSTPEADEISPDKGKAAESSASELDADTGDNDLPRTPAGEEHAIKRRALQARHREYRVTLHRVKFLQGDVYHQLGASYAPAEDEAYERADNLRKSLLKDHEDNAMRAMAQLNRDAAGKGLTREELLIQVPYFDQLGRTRSMELTDEADKIIENLLNEQSKLLWSWRSRIYTLLTQKLSAAGEEADGQEFARTLETQSEAETYLQAYTALLADRREVLVAERTLLAAHDAREKKIRHTKAAMKAAAAAIDLRATKLDTDDMERLPEHDILHKELGNERKALLRQFQGRALKSVLIDLNAMANRMGDKDPEKNATKQCVQTLRQLISGQGPLMDKLEADLNQFRKAFNERILYFRQLQELSDSVAEVILNDDLNEALQTCKVEQDDLAAKINTSRARQRYLEHLARTQEEGLDEDDEACVLCRCEFDRGYITPCAHMFCEQCLDAWLKKKEGQACPVCRVIINVNQTQHFTIRSTDVRPPKPVNNEPTPRSRRDFCYNMIDRALFRDIQKIPIIGSYGSKIQALTRHLLYLQAEDPIAKSIVFSAWADSLNIIEHSLITNGIPCLRIDQNGRKQVAAKKFRTDPHLLVLLLHGERENAGLNLTCASRVFLMESVVHHGFELQAIARIDRMSQLQETEVYCYYAEDTVERNILDLAARQGQSLYTKDNSAGTVEVSFVPETGRQSARTINKRKVQTVQKGDFIYKTDDMLSILFPHMFFPSDYVDQDMQVDSPVVESQTSQSLETSSSIRRRVAANSNAEAGPSRLHW